MGADAADIGLTIHPHPTLSETVGMAAEVFEGTITDLYMPKEERRDELSVLLRNGRRTVATRPETWRSTMVTTLIRTLALFAALLAAPTLQARRGALALVARHRHSLARRHL